MTIAGDLLTEAFGIVTGARNTTHGDKERSFNVIAQFWQTYLDARPPGPLTGRDVAQLMVLLKIARSIVGTPIRDHFLDEAGYAATAWECEVAEQKADDALKKAIAAFREKHPESTEDIWPCGCYRMDGEVGGCNKCGKGV